MELLDTNASPIKVYKQAKRILKSTSRAKSADWYARSHEIQLQWHIWVGSGSVVSAIFNKSSGEWWDGPELPRVTFALNDIGEPDGLDDVSRNSLHEILRQLLASKGFGFKPKSLGITMHLADGLRIRELAPDFSNDSDFDNLNELLIAAPEVALGDDSIDPNEGRWRLLPLIGNVAADKLSLAIQVSSQYESIIQEFRDYGELRNIPIVAEARSAALESMAGVPTLLPDGKSLENTLMLIQFEGFTLLCATGSKGEITLVRPLMHRTGGLLSPPEVSEFINNTAALLNMKAPDLILISMTGVPEDELQDLLSAYLESHPDATRQCINAKTSPLVEKIPGNRFEIATATIDHSITPESSSLHQLVSKWAIQDFYGLSSEESQKVPSRSDLNLLKFAGLSQKVALVGLFAFVGWTGTDFFTKMSSESWKLHPTAAQEMELRLVELQKERRNWVHWDGLLTKRSEGWLSLETLLSLFPDNGGVILNSASYRAESVGSGNKEDDSVGIKRTWQASGYANPEVAKQLSTLGSRTRLAGMLNAIAEANQADYLTVGTPTRDLSVTLQQKQGAMPPTFQYPARVARHFRTAFDLSIVHSLDSNDEFALNTNPINSEP